MKETQLLKGVLDGCVLKIISQQEIYGYELVQYLRAAGFNNIVGGTVYPLLQKLEKQQLIVGEMKESAEGPNRKYFKITSDGLIYLKQFNAQWNRLVLTVNQLMETEARDWNG
ncbi:PadR family transcriptional regulator [Vagococcus vulneris]|uniref:PadR family transcriptional regulator n=1 Tax=Vagococcus vulneris TaxID=1977869 RepID=A0A429ZXK0_9ENTE|nr:PadR family transcriptional regulator [Vagococcus vulneris]RST98621.1 PadR family transcriptional regulator [Vagococcus vulneris]